LLGLGSQAIPHDFQVLNNVTMIIPARRFTSKNGAPEIETCYIKWRISVRGAALENGAERRAPSPIEIL
jgi:hypothetical protein